MPAAFPEKIGNLLEDLRRRLAGVSETPALDGQVLLAHLLGRPRAWVLAHPEATLDPAQRHAFDALARRLEAGEPLPYVLGHWEFFGLDFEISPAALIPRPETELLVETALAWLGQRPSRRLAADIGAGSGCIAVSLAVNCPDLWVLVSDLSMEALHLARRNAHRHAVTERIGLVQCDLLAPAGQRFDLICANLPYVPENTLLSLAVTRWEPLLALDGGPLGLTAIRRTLQDAPRWLAPSGLLLLEIESSQGGAVAELARAAFPHGRVELLPDLAGRDRLVRVENG
jgi:release factor glutamine methyltransferase